MARTHETKVLSGQGLALGGDGPSQHADVDAQGPGIRGTLLPAQAAWQGLADRQQYVLQPGYGLRAQRPRPYARGSLGQIPATLC